MGKTGTNFGKTTKDMEKEFQQFNKQNATLKQLTSKGLNKNQKIDLNELITGVQTIKTIKGSEANFDDVPLPTMKVTVNPLKQ